MLVAYVWSVCLCALQDHQYAKHIYFTSVSVRARPRYTSWMSGLLLLSQKVMNLSALSKIEYAPIDVWFVSVPSKVTNMRGISS
jgi:hypothetical protein